MATITLADFEENDTGADELNQMFNDVDMMFNDDDSESGNEDEHDAMPEHQGKTSFPSAKDFLQSSMTRVLKIRRFFSVNGGNCIA